MALSGMGRDRRPRSAGATVALLLAVGCGGSSSSPPPSPPSSDPDVITVRGSERIAWNQPGYTPDLQFRAYIDGAAVTLDGAACDAAAAGREGFPCASPLPTLTDGLHTIALAAVHPLTELESAHSTTFKLRKLSSDATTGSYAAAEGRRWQTGRRAIGRTLLTSDGQAFDLHVVATRLVAPTQMAVAPDGRLFVVERTGGVRVVPAAGSESTESTDTLDVGSMFDLPAAVPPGLALHPDFARNHFVYLAHVALDERGPARLQLVRLREVHDTLGEPAVLLDEPLAGVPVEGPRLVFGPDRLLYVALAQRVVARTRESLDPAPGGVILRLTDEGAAAQGSAVFSYGEEQPVAFDWQPGTGALWAALASPDGRATLLRPIAAGGRFGRASVSASSPGFSVGRASVPGGMLFHRGPAAGPLSTTAWIALPENESLLRVTLDGAAPADVLLPRVLGRIGDIVHGVGGVLFIATRNRDGHGAVVAGDDLVVRLTPRERRSDPR